MIGCTGKNNDVFFFIEPEELESGEKRIKGEYFDSSGKKYDLEMVVFNLRNDKTEKKIQGNKCTINVNEQYFQRLKERNLSDHKGYSHINIILTTRMNIFEQADYESLKNYAKKEGVKS